MTHFQNIRAVLRGGAFARYMTGEAISMTGTWMQLMAQGWVMTTLTSSAAMLGMVNFATGIPMIALTILGGTFADRYDKRWILLATQIVQIILALFIGTLIGQGRVAIWHILAVAVVLGISNSFEMPAASALVPELVKKEHLATAIAVDRAIFHGTRLVGPALAGYVIGAWGTASAFYLNAISYVALMIAVATIHPRAKGTAEEEDQRRTGMKEGWLYVRSDKPTLAMLALMASITIFVFPVMVVMLPLYVKNVLHLGPDKMGLLMGAAGTGALVGSIGLLGVQPAMRHRFLLTASIMVVLALFGLSRASHFALAVPCMILISLGVSTMVGLSNTVVQERAPGPLRGRVSALAGLSFFGIMPFASLGITSLADAVGIRTALLISSFTYAAAAMFILLGPARRLAKADAAMAELRVEA
jgi:MFS family permease